MLQDSGLSGIGAPPDMSIVLDTRRDRAEAKRQQNDDLRMAEYSAVSIMF